MTRKRSPFDLINVCPIRVLLQVLFRTPAHTALIAFLVSPGVLTRKDPRYGGQHRIFYTYVCLAPSEKLEKLKLHRPLMVQSQPRLTANRDLPKQTSPCEPMSSSRILFQRLSRVADVVKFVPSVEYCENLVTRD